MKKFRFTLALATILLVTACHNAGSSTAQEVEDENAAKTEEHGGHAKPEEHGAASHESTTHENAASDTTLPSDTMLTKDSVPHEH
jgi:outer membrane biogenesis lipoprotein LolB